jgi:hypothetical protein
MSHELDLSDPRVRDMAARNHQPTEVWTLGGDLISLHCEQCGHPWPCPTRQALDARLAALDSTLTRGDQR